MALAELPFPPLVIKPDWVKSAQSLAEDAGGNYCCDPQIEPVIDQLSRISVDRHDQVPDVIIKTAILTLDELAGSVIAVSYAWQFGWWRSVGPRSTEGRKPLAAVVCRRFWPLPWDKVVELYQGRQLLAWSMGGRKPQLGVRNFEPDRIVRGGDVVGACTRPTLQYVHAGEPVGIAVIGER